MTVCKVPPRPIFASTSIAAVVALRSITPVVALITKPAVPLKVPPVSPVILGVGSACSVQYSLSGYVKEASSPSVIVTMVVLGQLPEDCVTV